jgi:hypothetical protein
MGKNIVDQYAYLHLATGIITYFWGISLMNWIVLHTIFEIVENTTYGISIINKYFTFWPGGKPYPDSMLNRVGDTIFAILGWMSAYYLDKIGTKYGWYNAHIK